MNRGVVRYLLDANVFIQAYKTYYAFDIAPKFWNSLVDFAQSGSVFSIDRVKDELEKQKDQLSTWANGDFHAFFESTKDPEVLSKYGELMQWSSTQPQYTAAALAEFAEEGNADPWLIAYASVKQITIVTLERLNLATRKKIPIPNVCDEVGVQYIDTFELLRRLGVSLN